MARTGTPAQDDTLVILLASGVAIDEAATTTGLSRRTIYRRLDSAEFRERVRAARQTFCDQALGRLLNLRIKHVNNLDALGENADESGSTRLGASKAIIELGNKLRVEEELTTAQRELRQRVEVLEAARGTP